MPELLPAGSPIRRPAGRRVCAPNRGLSQLAASFVGFLCQGIRRAPCISSQKDSMPWGPSGPRVSHTPAPIWAPAIRCCDLTLYMVCRRIDSKCSLLSLILGFRESVSGGTCPSRLAMRLSGYAGRCAPGTGYRGYRLERPGRKVPRWTGRASGPPEGLKISLAFWKLVLPRKEVIQPHVPVRLPCYDFTPLTLHTFDASLPKGLGRRLRVQTTRVV